MTQQYKALLFYKDIECDHIKETLFIDECLNSYRRSNPYCVVPYIDSNLHVDPNVCNFEQESFYSFYKTHKTDELNSPTLVSQYLNYKLMSLRSDYSYRIEYFEKNKVNKIQVNYGVHASEQRNSFLYFFRFSKAQELWKSLKGAEIVTAANWWNNRIAEAQDYAKTQKLSIDSLNEFRFQHLEYKYFSDYKKGKKDPEVAKTFINQFYAFIRKARSKQIESRIASIVIFKLILFIEHYREHFRLHKSLSYMWVVDEKVEDYDSYLKLALSNIYGVPPYVELEKSRAKDHNIFLCMFLDPSCFEEQFYPTSLDIGAQHLYVACFGMICKKGGSQNGEIYFNKHLGAPTEVKVKNSNLSIVSVYDTFDNVSFDHLHYSTIVLVEDIPTRSRLESDSASSVNRRDKFKQYYCDSVYQYCKEDQRKWLNLFRALP